MENRNGMVVDTRLTRATGTAEREAALLMAANIPGGTRRETLGGDKNYDTKDFVAKLKDAAVTPHVTQHQHARRSSRLTGEPRGTTATRSASARGNDSKKSSVGSRPLADCAKRGIVAASE